jgi:hypothetical protein
MIKDYCQGKEIVYREQVKDFIIDQLTVHNKTRSNKKLRTHDVRITILPKNNKLYGNLLYRIGYKNIDKKNGIFARKSMGVCEK